MPLSNIHLAAWSRTCLQGSSLRKLRPWWASRERPAPRVIKEATAANDLGYMMAEDCASKESCKTPNNSACESASKSGRSRHYMVTTLSNRSCPPWNWPPSLKVHAHFVEGLTYAEQASV
jgi:hypothetical protein